LVLEMGGENYPTSTQILDFWHAYEKIGQWAKSHFKDSEKCSIWCERVKKIVIDGQIKEFILELQQIDYQKDSLENKQKLLTYLENNTSRMDYKNYIQKGYLIGSGAIESAQRNVIQQRMKRSG